MNFGGRYLLIAIVIVSALVALPGLPAFALDSDQHQSAILQANDFELDLETGVRIYRGDVVFRQGSMRLDCDELTTHYNDDHLHKGVCIGTPGQFEQRPEGQDAMVLGRARSITLDRVKGMLTLEEGADIEQAGMRMAGKLITYNLLSKKVRVSGAHDTSGASATNAAERPRLTIQPRQQD